jgi:hypothetical protein
MAAAQSWARFWTGVVNSSHDHARPRADLLLPQCPESRRKQADAMGQKRNQSWRAAGTISPQLWFGEEGGPFQNRLPRALGGRKLEIIVRGENNGSSRK